VMMGDYVDRGPDTRGVIEVLIGLQESEMPSTCLLGNHDTYIEAYLDEPEWFDRSIHWLNPRMGGDRTLASYGVMNASEFDPEATRDAFAAALPRSHLDFLRSCRLWRRIGSYLFVHAGIRPGIPIERQSREDAIWIREPFLSSKHDFGVKVVHGHTIVKAPEHHLNRIAIDTGAYRSGLLTCLVLEDAEAALLTSDGPRPFPLHSGTGSRVLVSGIRKFFGSD
jgi:serine/threonine protein phosphatase 1